LRDSVLDSYGFRVQLYARAVQDFWVHARIACRTDGQSIRARDGLHGTLRAIHAPTVRLLINEGWPIIPKNAYGRKLSRSAFKKPIDLRRVFLCYVNISIRIFDGNVSFPGLYGGLYRQNLPYKFKNSFGDFQNRNFEKS
jgi:hypothetical protein